MYWCSPPVFSGVRVTRSLVFCVMFCKWFVLFVLAIVLSVLWFTDSNHPFSIFKLFFIQLPFPHQIYLFVKSYSVAIRCSHLSQKSLFISFPSCFRWLMIVYQRLIVDTSNRPNFYCFQSSLFFMFYTI